MFLHVKVCLFYVKFAIGQELIVFQIFPCDHIQVFSYIFLMNFLLLPNLLFFKNTVYKLTYKSYTL